VPGSNVGRTSVGGPSVGGRLIASVEDADGNAIGLLQNPEPRPEQPPRATMG
jgi:hypothetical protein